MVLLGQGLTVTYTAIVAFSMTLSATLTLNVTVTLSVVIHVTQCELASFFSVALSDFPGGSLSASV